MNRAPDDYYGPHRDAFAWVESYAFLVPALIGAIALLLWRAGVFA